MRISNHTITAFVLAVGLMAPEIEAQVSGGSGIGPSIAAPGKTTGKLLRVGARKLERLELAGKLAKFREQIAMRSVPSRVSRRGPRRIDKWLGTFQVVQSKHYLVYTNGPKSTSRKFAKSLEKLYGFMQKRFPFADPGHHLECYIFKTKQEYTQFCVELAGMSATQAKATAGHARGHYYATYYQSPSADTVMHEAAHQVVGVCLKVPGVGSWFQEGMAVYIEKKIGNGSISGGLRSDLRRGNFYALDQMVQIPSLLADRNGRRNYRHAGALVEFLIETRIEPIEGRFPEFLRAARRNLGRGKSVSERLFKRVYGLSIAEVDALFKLHHRAPKAQPGKKSS